MQVILVHPARPDSRYILEEYEGHLTVDLIKRDEEERVFEGPAWQAVTYPNRLKAAGWIVLDWSI